VDEYIGSINARIASLYITNVSDRDVSAAAHVKVCALESYTSHLPDHLSFSRGIFFTYYIRVPVSYILLSASVM